MEEESEDKVQQLAEGIDNETYFMRDQLKLILGRFAKRAKIAVGFFFVTAFDNVEEEIKNLDEIKVIMGWRTNVMTKEELHIATEGRRMQDIGFPEEDIDAFIERKIEEVNSEDELVRLDAVMELIKSGKMEVRVRKLNKGYYHAKVYWFDCKSTRGDNIAIVGSHNLSKSAQQYNEEASAVIRNPSSTEFWNGYFERKWKESVPYNKNLIDIIGGSRKYKRYKKKKKEDEDEEGVLNFRYLPPIKFFRTLFKILGKEYLLERDDVLYPYQKIDYNLCRDVVQKFGGVILADSVGLGKSFVAARLVKDYVDEGKSFLFIVPPNTMEQWEEYLGMFGIDTDENNLISMYKVSQSAFPIDEYKDRDVIIVDESHNFRNMDSNRWGNFMHRIKSPQSDYILLTATPINNKIRDLYAQMQMFENPRFHNEDLINLYKALMEYSGQEKKKEEDASLLPHIKELREKIIVRTTRKDLKEMYDKIILPKIGEVEIKDPEVAQEIYHFTHSEYERLFRSFVSEFIEKLLLPHISIINPEVAGNLHGLYKVLLYKRMESSVYSLYKSIENLEERNRKLAGLLETQDLEEIRELEKKEYRKMLDEAREIEEESVQSYLDQSKTDADIGENDNGEWSLDTPKEAYMTAIRHDLGIIQKFKDILERLRESEFNFHDDKLNSLLDSLVEYADKKIIIFSQFTDTVDYLYENLKQFDPDIFRIRKVTGNTKHKIAECIKFSPSSYGDEMRKRIEEKLRTVIGPPWTDLLITSDTLSEGVNLREADAVINYDLPWNPVNIIQRVGRANRIGRTEDLRVINFIPEDHIDAEMNLISTLKNKISNIISVIGTEHCILSPEEMLMIRRKEVDDMDLLRRKRQMVAELDLDEMEDSEEGGKLSELDRYLVDIADVCDIRMEDIATMDLPDFIPYTILSGRDEGGIGIYKTTVGSEEYFGHSKIGNNGFDEVDAMEGFESPKHALSNKDKENIHKMVNNNLPRIESERKKSQQVVFDQDAELAKRRLVGKLRMLAKTNTMLEVLDPNKKKFKERIRKIIPDMERLNVPPNFKRRLQKFRTKWFSDNFYDDHQDEFIAELKTLIGEISSRIAPSEDAESIEVNIVAFISYHGEDTRRKKPRRRALKRKKRKN